MDRSPDYYALDAIVAALHARRPRLPLADLNAAERSATAVLTLRGRSRTWGMTACEWDRDVMLTELDQLDGAIRAELRRECGMHAPYLADAVSVLVFRIRLIVSCADAITQPAQRTS